MDGKNAPPLVCMVCRFPKNSVAAAPIPITTIAVMEGLGYGSPDQGLLFSINAHMWTNSIPLLKYGTPEQKKKYLPGLCDGSLIGANGASEPNAGSDVFSMRTRVTKDGERLRAGRHENFCDQRSGRRFVRSLRHP